MNSFDNTLQNTTELNNTSRPYTRVELIRKFEDMPISDALDQLPSAMAYQHEWIAHQEVELDRAKAALERVEITASVDWRPHFPVHVKPTVGEREAKAKLVALNSTEQVGWEEAKLKLKLIKVAYQYLEDKFVALRKLYEAPPPPQQSR